MAFSPLIKPCIKNCSANVVFPVPKEPRTRDDVPRRHALTEHLIEAVMPVSTNPSGCPLSPASVAAGAASVSAIVHLRNPFHIHGRTRP